MKTNIITITLISILSTSALASAQAWTFKYNTKNKDSFSLTFNAETKQEAYKFASKACFQKLTNGEYPGEAKGLEYIDICANPKM